jgi:hypothetical protein
MTTPAAALTLVDGEGGNTRIHYSLVSSGKKLAEYDVVLAGRISPEDYELIAEAHATDGATGFSSDALGIPNLEERMPNSWSASGDEGHVVTRVSYTNSKPSPYVPDAEHFAIGFERYDPSAAMSL